MSYSLTITADSYEALRREVEAISTVLSRFATVEEARMTPTSDALAKTRQPRPLSPTAVVHVDTFEPKVDEKQEVVIPEVEKTVEALVKNEKKTKAKPLPGPKALIDELDLKDATLATLKEAFASGKRAAVMDLLAKFGNGAKTFRELPDDAFPLIRKEIEAGALA